MQSYIIISKDEKEIEESLNLICRNYNIHKIDMTFFDNKEVLDKEVKNKNQSGILKIREILKNSFLKPIKGEYRAIIIKNCETLSLPAQNALLKLLEEPPSFLLLILTADQIGSILPTIISRCSTITSKAKMPEIHDEDLKEINNIINLISEKRPLFISQEILRKENPEMFIDKLILVLRNILIEKIENKEEARYLRYITSKLLIFKSTVSSPQANQRLGLENIFLEF